MTVRTQGKRKMINEILYAKYLPDDMIYRFLRNESDDEEKNIVNKLKDDRLNKERFWEIVKSIKNQSEAADNKPSGIIYEKMKRFLQQSIAKENSYNYSKALKENLPPSVIKHPSAGQIWITKRIINLSKYEFAVATPIIVYLLTNPEYYPFENNDMPEDFKRKYTTMIVLPASFLTNYAAQEDYIVQEGDSVLNQEFMIETGLETNMLTNSLDHYLGELSNRQIKELLSVYEKCHNLPDFDAELFNNAKKGKHSNKKYGDEYEFKLIELENIKHLSEPVSKLDKVSMELLEYESPRDIYENYREPTESLAASDQDVKPPSGQNTRAQLVLYSKENFEISLVVKDEGQLYIKLKLLVQQEGSNNLIIIKDALTNEELQKIENITLLKLIQYFHINKFLKNRLVTFSFFVNGRLYFQKNVDLRNTA